MIQILYQKRYIGQQPNEKEMHLLQNHQIYYYNILIYKHNIY